MRRLSFLALPLVLLACADDPDTDLSTTSPGGAAGSTAGVSGSSGQAGAGLAGGGGAAGVAGAAGQAGGGAGGLAGQGGSPAGAAGAAGTAGVAGVGGEGGAGQAGAGTAGEGGAGGEGPAGAGGADAGAAGVGGGGSSGSSGQSGGGGGASGSSGQSGSAGVAGGGAAGSAGGAAGSAGGSVGGAGGAAAGASGAGQGGVSGGGAGGAAGGGPASLCSPVESAFPIEPSPHLAYCTPLTFSTNPPSSGNHYSPGWAQFKSYTKAVPRGFWVHSMEHGAVAFLYNCTDDCSADVAKLQAIADAYPVDPLCAGTGVAHRIVIVPDPKITTRFAAAAWGYTLTASCLDDGALASFQSFLAAHYAKTPEDFCTGGVDYETVAYPANCGEPGYTPTP